MRPYRRISQGSGKSLFSHNNVVDGAGKILQHMVQSRPAEPATRRVARTTDEVGDQLRLFSFQHHRSKLLVAASVALALSACAPSRYMGISFKPGAAAPALQELARRAQTGDKKAQLELGIRYENGQGVRVHYPRAERLYRLAALETGGVALAYSPPAGNQTYGTVYRLDQGPVQPGLEEARRRLEQLRLRMKVVIK